MGEENPPGPHSHWLYLTQCAYGGELLEENAQELMTTGVTTTIWHFRLESIEFGRGEKSQGLGVGAGWGRQQLL